MDDDNNPTSTENNISTIVLFTIEGYKLLFTGDAGKTGLYHAVTYAESLGIPLTDPNFLDVPNHGSKHNLSSKVLSKLKVRTAFISASPNDPKHPPKRVTNALKKHQHTVYVNRSGKSATTLIHQLEKGGVR